MIDHTSIAAPAADYVKVANFPGLYRHTRSCRYYGVKKIRGKRRECSLRTSDRKIAERRLREWMRNLQVVDREVEETTLRGLLHKFVAANRGKSAKPRRPTLPSLRTWSRL